MGKNKKHPKVLDLLENLAGQHRQHHKPSEVLQSQVFCFWSAGGILTAREFLSLPLIHDRRLTEERQTVTPNPTDLTLILMKAPIKELSAR